LKKIVEYPGKIHNDPDGMWIEFIDLEGCVTQGDTEKELIRNAQEALSLFLEEYIGNNKEVPFPSQVKADDIVYINPYPEVAIPLLVKRLRMEQGLTQKDIAEKLGVSYQTYQKLERGQRVNPTLKTLEQIADVFNLRLVLDYEC
jgi:antitoxin HicB